MCKKATALLLALATIALLITGCKGGYQNTAENQGSSKTDKLEEIKTKGTLVVGCDPTIPNIIFMDEVTSEVTGFIPDIVNGFAAEIGVEVRWEILEWSAMLTAVNSGKVDMIAANMNMTIERASQIEFSAPWLIDHAKACVAIDSEYQTFSDLNKDGTKFGISSGSVYEEIIPNLFPKSKSVVLPLGTWQDALQTGVIDVAYDDGIVFAGPLSTNHTIRVLEENGISYLNGFAFPNKDYKTRDVFNLYLMKIKALGQYADLYEKWMGYPWKPDPSGVSF